MPKRDVFGSLRKEIARIPVIDCHEHLPPEAERLKAPVDFFTPFSHYCVGDLVAAGAPAETMTRLQAADTPVAEKWRLFAPYYAAIADGSYARCAHRAIKRFYRVGPPASTADAQRLTERIRAANKPGLYRKVLRDACGIVTSLNNADTKTMDLDLFTPVRGVSDWAEVLSIEKIRQVAQEAGRDVTSLARYVQALADIMEAERRRGTKGMKFGWAYCRSLDFRSVATADAERLFNRVFEDSQGRRPLAIGYEESRPLQDYLTHQLVALAGDLGLTAVFHTGIHAGNENTLDNARPERLWNLFRRYPATRFDVFHIGLPWTDEAGIQAKYFANVWVDFAWAHAISPEIAVRALRTYVDLVPRNKVLGFGGDYLVVEKVYGHLELARDNIARALADKVADGAISHDAALAWARAILHDNPIAAYRLDVAPLDVTS